METEPVPRQHESRCENNVPFLYHQHKSFSGHLFLLKNQIHIALDGEPPFFSSSRAKLGQAKQRKRLLIEKILAECELLETPATLDREKLLADVLRLRFQKIPRYDKAALHGFAPLQCHDNAIGLQKGQPVRAKAIHGWWRDGHGFVFHSVVKWDDQIMCITPVYAPDGVDPHSLIFAEDPRIKCIDVDGQLVMLRDGKPVPRRLTLDPEFDRVMASRMRQMLQSGADPDRVLRAREVTS